MEDKEFIKSLLEQLIKRYEDKLYIAKCDYKVAKRDYKEHQRSDYYFYHFILAQKYYIYHKEFLQELEIFKINFGA